MPKRTKAQIGKLSRTRGGNFERKICQRLRKKWPDATVRRSQQSHRAHESDVVVEGAAEQTIDRIWWELTDSAMPNVAAKLAQAQRDTAAKLDRFPVVVWHRKGAKTTQATMSLFVLANLVDPRGGNGLIYSYDEPVTLDLEDFLGLLL